MRRLSRHTRSGLNRAAAAIIIGERYNEEYTTGFGATRSIRGAITQPLFTGVCVEDIQCSAGRHAKSVTPASWPRVEPVLDSRFDVLDCSSALTASLRQRKSHEVSELVAAVIRSRHGCGCKPWYG